MPEIESTNLPFDIEQGTPVSEVVHSRLGNSWATLKGFAAGLALSSALVVGAAYFEHAHDERASHSAQADGDSQDEITRITKILGSIDPSLEGISPSVIDGSSLKSVNTLPGYGKKVTPELGEQLEQSTLQISYRQKGVNEPWQESCTAEKVELNGKFYMLTSNHCFGKYEQQESKGHGGPTTYPNIRNLTKIIDADYEFAILDPTESLEERVNSDPVAYVTGIAVDESQITDLALLSAEPTEEFKAFFDSMPALNLNRLMDDSEEPELGQSVDVHSVPEDSDQTPVSNTGVYLGRMEISGSVSQTVDLVGLEASGPNQDACNYGGSGSMAVLASGQITGTLSWRNNTGYGKYDTYYPPDAPATDVPYRLQEEQYTGFDLDRFDTICGYTVVKSGQTVSNLVKALDNPSFTYNYPYTGGK